MAERKHIIESLLQNMYAMRHKLVTNYAPKKETAITPSQGFVLRFVAQNASVNVKAIAQALHITSSAATQLIDGLVEKGCLVRTENPDDRRAVTLSLSLKAKKMFKEFKAQGVQSMTQLFDALTDQELADYALLNQKLLDFISKKNHA